MSNIQTYSSFGLVSLVRTLFSNFRLTTNSVIKTANHRSISGGIMWTISFLFTWNNRNRHNPHFEWIMNTLQQCQINSNREQYKNGGHRVDKHYLTYYIDLRQDVKAKHTHLIGIRESIHDKRKRTKERKSYSIINQNFAFESKS